MGLIVIVLLIFCLGITVADNQSQSQSHSFSLTKSISQFTADLYSTIASSQTSNIILSPFSAQIALSLLYCGAQGATANALSKGLKLHGSKDDISHHMEHHIESFEKIKGLQVAENIFVMKNNTLTAKYASIAKNDFHTDIKLVNFAENVKATDIINTWIKNKTKNKIRNFISANSLGKNTKMILANAIYFKQDWKQHFPAGLTARDEFHTGDTTFVQVEMMHIRSKFPYGTFPHLKVNCLELPYSDPDLSMLIILPNSPTGLAQFEKRLKNVDIIGLSKKLHKTEMEVSIPKFKVEFGVSLVDALRTLGMSVIFSKSANFKAIFNSEQPLFISDVVQKVFIEVNEKGTDAAAATKKNRRIEMTSQSYDPRIFKADHPFIFVLKKKNDILIIGRFVQ